MRKPDLSTTPLDVRIYIDYLEQKLDHYEKLDASVEEPAAARAETFIASEPETNINIVTLSATGTAKKSHRHLYGRQHRGGMGVFDLDCSGTDYPTWITPALPEQTLLIFTNKARVFRQSLSRIDASEVRAKGDYFLDRLPVDPDETIVAALPERASGYIALVSTLGRIRCLRHHLFGEHMKAGTAMFNATDYGPLASVCWTPGNADLFVLSRLGLGIRFSEKLVSPQGDRAMKLAENDRITSICSVDDDSLVFMVGADGKGTIRSMTGFAANKSLGGNGKIAMKNDQLVSALTVNPTDDIFIISRSGKMIRFHADEIPTTDNPVQGVNCLMMRFDEVTAAANGNAID